MRIAIVGAGLSGSSVLRSLVEAPSTKKIEKIDVFEFRKEVSRGLPYQEDDSALLMNSDPHRISGRPDCPDDFVNWLEASGFEDEMREGLVQRRYYGRYLKQIFSQHFQDDRVQVHKTKVVDFQVCDRNDQLPYKNPKRACHYFLQTEEEGWLGYYDAVFFAIGHPPYADYYDLEGAKHFVRSPYPVKQKLECLTSNRKIGILGSASTAFDILRFLKDRDDLQRPFTFYIRTTPFTPTKVRLSEEVKVPTFNEEWIENNRDSRSGQLKLQTIIDQFLADLDQYGADWKEAVEMDSSGDLSENIRQYYLQPRNLGIIQEYISYLTPHLPDLYNALSTEDREMYNLRYRPHYEHFRHVVPFETMGEILKDLRSGELRILSGLTNIEWDEKEEVFQIYCQGRFHENCDILINATGFELRLQEASRFSPLVNNLYNKGHVVPAQADGKGVAVTWPEAQVISQKMGTLPHVYFLGHYIHLTQYGNNNVQLILKQGRRSAEHLLKCREVKHL